MPFSDAVELFDYWAEYPPVHLLVRGYLGYEGTGSRDTAGEQNPMEVAAAMRATGFEGRPAKLSQAPKQVQERFAALKEQAKEMKRKKRAG